MTSQGWTNVRLGDVLRVKHGFAFKGEFFGSSGDFIVVTPGNFRDGGGFKAKDGQEKFYTAVPPPEYLLRRGDLIVAMTEQTEGLIGSSAIVPEDQCYLHNQRIGLVDVTAPHLADKKFLYYVFNTPNVRAQLESTATGAKIRHTAPGRIEAVRVALPPLTVQRRVAGILSAYDDLIENNTRRIQILEEMAAAIYREWFVEFRFPGHERVEIVDSREGRVPAGWMGMPIGKAVTVLGGGTPSREVDDFWRAGEITWYTPSDLTRAGTMFMTRSHERITEKGLSRSSATLFPSRSVMMTSRATIGVVAISSGEATTNQGFITCVPNERLSDYHLYFWLKSNVDLFSSLASGATFKEISRSKFKPIPIVVPPPDVEESFRSLVAPLGDLILNLQLATANLRTTRDLLLPRLISGEIDVSNLNIGDAEPAA